MSPPVDRRPSEPSAPRPLTGLTPEEAARSAFEVLSSVAWRGYVSDPAVTRAHDFLRAL